MTSKQKPKTDGNWHPFPPPGPGFYHVRQVKRGTGTSEYSFDVYDNRRVYEGAHGRLMCMGMRITRMKPQEGWQFQFLQEEVDRRPIQLRPYVVLYEINNSSQVAVRSGVRDVTGQLPIARSYAEARYIVSQIPTRWPLFWHIHVEYHPEVLQS